MIEELFTHTHKKNRYLLYLQKDYLKNVVSAIVIKIFNMKLIK